MIEQIKFLKLLVTTHWWRPEINLVDILIDISKNGIKQKIPNCITYFQYIRELHALGEDIKYISYWSRLEQKTANN